VRHGARGKDRSERERGDKKSQKGGKEMLDISNLLSRGKGGSGKRKKRRMKAGWKGGGESRKVRQKKRTSARSLKKI